MDDTLRARADARLEAALAEQDAYDTRDLFRAQLRRLKTSDAAAFARGVRYFEETLVPRLAGDAEPLAEWMEYGRFLAELGGRGRTVAVDASGRSRAFSAASAGNGDSAGPSRDLVLFLPDDTRGPALPLARPRELSAPQRAAWRLLVEGRREL